MRKRTGNIGRGNAKAIGQLVLVGLVLVFAVSLRAEDTHHASHRAWTRIDKKSGGFEEGLTVGGKRHGFWKSKSYADPYRTYYVLGRDMDAAFVTDVYDTPSLLKLLQEAEADVDELVFNYGRGTLLHAATIYARHDVIRALLSIGADPNLEGEGTSFSGRTPVWYAVKDHGCPDLEAVDILVQGGADITVRDRDNDTLLHALAHTWECDNDGSARAFVRKLISLGLDIDAKNDKGRTALNVATVDARSISVVRALIEYGADVNSRDQFGRTPLHTLTDPKEIVIPIIYAYDQYVSEWRRRQSRIGLLLLKNWADPKLLDEHGKRPLDLIRGSWLARTSLHRRLARQTEI